MSAGDALFIGWKGASPFFKEFAPSVQFNETDRPGIVEKNVTINRICFDKYRESLIKTMPAKNASLNSVYVDDDGSSKSVFMGGGYTLKSITVTPHAVGVSKISAQYSKSVSDAFEIGLPDLLQIQKTGDSVSIIYDGQTIEQISGVSESSEAYELKYNYNILDENLNLTGSPTVAFGFISFYDYKGNEVVKLPATRVNPDFAKVSGNSTLFDVSVYAADKEASRTVILAKDSGIEPKNVNFVTPVDAMPQTSLQKIYGPTGFQQKAADRIKQELEKQGVSVTSVFSNSFGYEILNRIEVTPEGSFIEKTLSEALYVFYAEINFDYYDINTKNVSVVLPRWEGTTLKIGNKDVYSFSVS